MSTIDEALAKANKEFAKAIEALEPPPPPPIPPYDPTANEIWLKIQSLPYRSGPSMVDDILKARRNLLAERYVKAN